VFTNHMSAITSSLIELSEQRLEVAFEESDHHQKYQRFNTGGVEVEVGEFLYGLVRMLKASSILETGTHLGISSAYMGMALKANARVLGDPGVERCFIAGSLTTLEIFAENKKVAEDLWKSVGVDSFVNCVLQRSVEYVPDYCLPNFDMAILDSEPDIRFAEFERFWPFMRHGCVIAIHDLHSHLGHEGQTVNDVYDWPFGDVRKTFLGEMIRSHEVSVMSFPTPRGLTIFQKTAPHFLHTKIAKGIE
jgi:predicted O-methyltransferase YrrM